MQSCSLEIANYCNHHCLKCLHSKFNKMPRKLGMLSFDKWKYMIDHLYTYEYIGIGGAGESTLHPQFYDFIDYIYCKNPVAKVGFHSNGSTLDREHMEFYIKYNINDISFSVDAASTKTHSIVHGLLDKNDDFKKIMNSIEEFVELKKEKDSKIKISLSFIIQPENIYDLLPFLQYLQRHPDIPAGPIKMISPKLGYSTENNDISLKCVLDECNRYIQLNSMNVQLPVLGQVKNGSVNVQQLDWCSCSFPFVLYPITTWDGYVMPCVWVNEIKYALGNIFEQNFNEVVYGEKRKLIEKVFKEKKYFEFCHNCLPLGTYSKKIMITDEVYYGKDI